MYAIIYETNTGRKYLKGFTSEVWMQEVVDKNGKTYTVKLPEISSLFVPLEGDAAIYIS